MSSDPTRKEIWEQPGIPKTIDINQATVVETQAPASGSHIATPPVDFWLIVGGGSVVVLVALFAFEMNALKAFISGRFSRTKSSATIPCKHCRFFSDNYYLKCTVHPLDVMTDRAVDCRDFCSRRMPQRSDKTLKR